MSGRFRDVVLAGLMALMVIQGRLSGQSLGNAGTIEGVVDDPSGATVAGATVTVVSPLSGYRQSATFGPTGEFRLTNLPPRGYHLTVHAAGFASYSEDVTVRNSVPIDIHPKLLLGGTATSVNVEANGADLVENDPTPHEDVDRSVFAKLPSFDPGASLNQAIIFSTGAVAADANGFFHPLGDHAQVSFVIDGQPISDQQSKVFSTQLPTSAIQSMELITGAPQAEFGDKTSLVDQITMRSGLGASKQFGSVETYYGTFGSVGGDVSYGVGTAHVGNFIALDGTRSGRFSTHLNFNRFTTSETIKRSSTGSTISPTGLTCFI